MSWSLAGWLPGVVWLGLAAAACGPTDDGPVPVPWDRVACAECRMLVGDPRFAGQIRTAAGERLHFDDPGCLLLHLADGRSDAEGIWVHHVEEARWLPLDEAGFVEVGPSPMGYGLGAVERGAPDALDRAQALRRVRGALRPRATP